MLLQAAGTGGSHPQAATGSQALTQPSPPPPPLPPAQHSMPHLLAGALQAVVQLQLGQQPLLQLRRGHRAAFLLRLLLIEQRAVQQTV